MQVHNIINNGVITNNELFEQLSVSIEAIVCSGDKLSANYAPHRLQLDRHLTFDVLMDGADFVAFSGIFNGDRYPKGVYRILNRTYVFPRYRSGGMVFNNWCSKYILPVQYSAHWSYIDTAFVSVQDLNSHGFLKYWVKNCAPIWGSRWVVPDNLFKVCNSETKSCYQHIAYCNINVNGYGWPDNTGISPEQWRKLPD